MERSTPLNRAYLRDIVIVSIFALVYGFLVINARDDSLFYGDTTWYALRAKYVWQGILSPLYVYNLSYPVLVGLFNLVLNDLIWALVITNMLLLPLFFAGAYVLGRIYYNRQIAWIAVILIATNTIFMQDMRALQTLLMFSFMIVLCLLVQRALAQRPTLWRAMLLGLSVSVAFFTRFEGILFAMLIPLTVVQIVRNGGKPLRALWLGLASTVVIIPFALVYGRVFFGSLTSENRLSILGIVTTPGLGSEQLILLSSQAVDMAFSLWPLWLWIILFWSISQITRKTHYTLPNAGAAILFILYLGLLIVANVTAYSRFSNYAFNFTVLSLPFIAWGLWALGSKLHPRYGIPLLLIPAIVPALFILSGYLQTPLFAYRDSSYVEDARRIDLWLAQTGASDTIIWTMCPWVPVYTHSDMRYIYRLGSRDDVDIPDSPANLLPVAYENSDYIMDCGLWYYKDWTELFNGTVSYTPYRLEPVITIQSAGDSPYPYHFSKVVRDG